jgi:hypothetical protein
MKKLTQKEFIEKLTQYYGKYSYDFSKVKYINTDTPVSVICKEHGEFKVIPYKLFKNNLHICKHCKKQQLPRVIDTSSFIKKANLIHNNQYDYSQTAYTNNSTPVDIICKEHGVFSLTPEEHLSFQRKCPHCKKQHQLTKTEILNRFNQTHSSHYIYPEFEFKKTTQKIDIICPQHGKFSQKISLHLLGHKCKKCSGKTNEDFKRDVIKKYGDKFNFSKTHYQNNTTPVTLECKIHGEFNVKPRDLLQGIECKKCSEIRHNIEYEKNFLENANKIHSSEYDYSKVQYNGRFTPVSIICKKHGEFPQTPGDHLQGSGCPKCAISKIDKTSSYENEIIEFLKQSNQNPIQSYRIENKEIDIYIPDLNLGIEFNGTYWHSHLFKSPKYHFNKTEFFKKHNINIIHIWEHQWTNPIKQDILKSMLVNKLQQTPNKIYARKCVVKYIDSKIYSEFCMNNHIQGKSPSSIKLGLFYNSELVACMGFSLLRVNLGNTKSSNKYELVRYCSLKNTNIIGGASKMLKYFENQYNPLQILSYADRDYSQGNLYESLGFEFEGITNISYNYYNPKTHSLKNRYNFRKSELIKKGYPSELTEFQITHSMGLYRIYNSGTLKYVKKAKF